ncbi:pyruvate kinase [Propionispira arboris]|uniref:Pyruvate kinase n=1 Tax=Propionispira arboris TaxID=84035 RepID=A0A1H6WWB9_9FIRM|nr:pyruvate kinase [Propionispira arboris]SEJ16645.1 pyruvate kinase [Propionispira arboris]
MLKKTKIVCTMGPSTENQAILDALIENRMNVARFNFSHGDHAEHAVRIKQVRDSAKKAGKVISFILDTKGPEMRLGTFAEGKVQLEKGKKFVLTYSDEPGDVNHAPVSHKVLYKEVKPGDTILLSDGLVGLNVEGIDGKDIVTTILNNGAMGTRKRIAVPGVSVSLPPISEQDEKDIIFGIENDMDFVAASFIQRAEDVQAIRKLITEHGGHMEIIPKIENLEGVKNIDSIIAAADGIMVARGDLGVEIPAEDVPLIQKEIIKKCNKAGKPVIVATQMLESMTNNPRPTRAEASDVANAILDGTDAIMLSGETASGDYPVEAVQTMNKIAQRIETSLQYEKTFVRKGFEHQENTTDAIAHATVQLAYELDAAAIITPTESGYTTKVVSKYRPQAAILAFAANEKVARHLNLRWGVYSVLGKPWNDVDEMISAATSGVVKENYLKHGDLTIITSGMKFGEGSTSSIRVHTI